MIFGNDWILTVFIALVIDMAIGEFPVKHPVEFMGDFIKNFEKIAYKDNVFRGAILFILLVFAVGFISTVIQLTITVFPKIFGFPEIISPVILGILASTGLAGKSL